MKYITKAILNTEEVTDLGIDWARSKRTLLQINECSLLIGKKEILISQIIDAKIRIIPSAYFIPGAVLSITENAQTHHFGLSYSKKLINSLSFVDKVEKAPNPPTLWTRRIFNMALLGLVLFSFISKII